MVKRGVSGLLELAEGDLANAALQLEVLGCLLQDACQSFDDEEETISGAWALTVIGRHVADVEVVRAGLRY
jgi:hypothetical protein